MADFKFVHSSSLTFAANSSVSKDSTRSTVIATLRCAMGVFGANAETIKGTTIGLGELEGCEAKHGIGPLTREETMWIEAFLDGNETTNVGILVSDADEGDRPVLAPMRTATIFEDRHLFDFLPNVLVNAWAQRVTGAVVDNVDPDGIMGYAQEGGRVLEEAH